MIIANYKEHHKAFSTLLENNCSKPILLLTGESGIGKSTLLRCFQEQIHDGIYLVSLDLRNISSVMKIFLHIGRILNWDYFDNFKQHLSDLIHRFNINVNGNSQAGVGNMIYVELDALFDNTTSEQRSQYYAVLTEAWIEDINHLNKPCVFLFDSYETAKHEIKAWIEGDFLNCVVNSQQIRVVIAGQVVPSISLNSNHRYELLKLSGVHDPQDWLPIVEARGRVIPSQSNDILYLAGICSALNGNPSDISSIIDSFPLQKSSNIKVNKQSSETIANSNHEQSIKLNELKVLLVGDGGAGKTSISKVLRDKKFNPQENKTHGINIDHWQRQDCILHFWDFGGQEIMHATHQFFLSKHSLYILVLDGRKEEDAEYWLKHIESFGGDSPILIVLNKMDENPAFDVNRKHLLEKYQGIVGFYKLSCNTQDGLDEFKQALINSVDKVLMLQPPWGESWFKVKKSLESWQQHYITCESYRDLCSEQQINDTQTQDILAQYLSDLGVVVHFADLELNDTHVLEPRWITEAVYKIINSKQLAAKHGLLNLKDLVEILQAQSLEDYQYPSEKHLHIIELMKKFELCYQVDKNQILIPDLLDVQEPDFDFDDKQPLRFRLQYDFLPKSIMPRFIVKRHQDIKDNLRWRTGVVLHDKNNDATAIIRTDDRERLIDIQVYGKQKRDYFAMIRGTLNEIRNSFEKLEITELVPLPDNPKICVEYSELIGYEQAGKDDYFVGKLGKSYSISELLNGLEKRKEWKAQTIVNIEKGGKLEMTEQKNEFGNGNTIGGSVNAGNSTGSFNVTPITNSPQNDNKTSYIQAIIDNKWSILAIFVFLVIVILGVGYYAVEKEIITHKLVTNFITDIKGKEK